jgi:hypothetical protein
VSTLFCIIRNDLPAPFRVGACRPASTSRAAPKRLERLAREAGTTLAALLNLFIHLGLESGL